MLAAVIESYVESLAEREFDSPFMTLLRLNDFTDIHFLHGSFEFGKDFIAKRCEGQTIFQYAFQSKAGDIALADWHQCRGQIDLLRTNVLAHPNFDKTLPRRAVFVTTGRLVGGAGLAAQDYGHHLSDLREAAFSTWDRDTIIEMLTADPRCLSGSAAALLHILGAKHDKLNFALLENYSRSWIRNEFTPLSLRDVLEAAVIAQYCRRENRLDLASQTTLMLTRSLWATVHGANPLPELARVAIATARDMFRHYAMDLWRTCANNYLDPDALLREGRIPGGFVTYPLRCLILAELLAMLGLLERSRDLRLSSEIADYLAAFVAVNAGAAHPISDRWGVSVVCCALLLSIHGKTDALRPYLRSTIKWIADNYDVDTLGLAGPHASPDEETAYLLGSPFEHITLARRSESYNATQLLDLFSVLEDEELFDLARNEFLAVNICLPVLEVDDSSAQYSINSPGQRYESNVPFLDYWHPHDGWKVAPHHDRGPDRYYAEIEGESWDQLAISCVVRDRHFVKTWRRLVDSRDF